jgi:lipid-binding SYLF domain-containing protein
MMMSKKHAWFVLTVVAVVLIGAAAASADEESEQAKMAKQREKTDQMASTSLDRLMSATEKANAMLENSYGYAVFDTTKAGLGVTGSGGTGVAVNNASGERTYMKMGGAGIGASVGAQNYQLIFMFENQEAFEKFVDGKWQGEPSAEAAAGTEGASATSTFSHGVAVYKLTDKGLMASADISGNKYWVAEKLNSDK